jgi:hypothetical protein
VSLYSEHQELPTPVASADALTKVKPILAKTTLIERDREYVLSLQMS